MANVPGTPFTTFFGDYLHGLWVTWNTYDAGSGDVGFEVEFQANYRSKMNSYYRAGLADDDNLPHKNYDFSGEASDGTAWSTTQTFMFYLAWNNPDSTGSVAKDGIYARHICTLTTGTPAASAQPTLSCVWMT